MWIQNIFKTAISIFSITITQLTFLLQSPPTLANPNKLESWRIYHPTISFNGLSRGKLSTPQDLKD